MCQLHPFSRDEPLVSLHKPDPEAAKLSNHRTDSISESPVAVGAG